MKELQAQEAELARRRRLSEALMPKPAKKAKTAPKQATGKAKHQPRIVDWEADEDVLELRRGIPTKFYDVWKEGLEAYLRGDWTKATKSIPEALELKPGDGPGEPLLHILAHHSNQAPNDWPGWRKCDGH